MHSNVECFPSSRSRSKVGLLPFSFILSPHSVHNSYFNICFIFVNVHFSLLMVIIFLVDMLSLNRGEWTMERTVNVVQEALCISDKQ